MVLDQKTLEKMDFDIFETFINGYSNKDKTLINRGFAFAYRVHRTQKRKSGEEYIIHPLSVASILALGHADADTITAGLLHDTIEDGKNITKEMIAQLFNPCIAYLVDGVTKMKKLEFDNDKQMTDEANMRKIVTSLLIDPRIFQIKLADRLHNMLTLEYQPEKKQQEISSETMELFVPFAGLIGDYQIKMDLQDLCFSYLNPEKYNLLRDLRKEEKKKNINEVREVEVTIVNALSSKNIDFNYSSEFEKNLYELARRLETYGSFDKIHDLYVIQLQVNDVDTCYEVKRIIESLFEVVEEKSKDYIEIPKTNLYEALHVTVKGSKGRMVQVQIMTKKMSKINKNGITAYWELGNTEGGLTPAEMMQQTIKKLQFFKYLKELKELDLSNAEFNKNVKNDILSRMIYVSLENGEIIEVPVGSTLLDLAYKLDDDNGYSIGDFLEYGIVNGEYVRKDFVLKNKDIVALRCNVDFIGPRENLEDKCVTEKAKRKIRKK